MLFDDRLQIVDIVGIERIQIDHLLVDLLPECSSGIPHIRDAAAQARREIPAGLAEDHGPTGRHVFAAVVAHTLDDSFRATVAHAEAFAADAADVDLAACRAIRHDIAGDHILLGLERG